MTLYVVIRPRKLQPTSLCSGSPIRRLIGEYLVSDIGGSLHTGFTNF